MTATDELRRLLDERGVEYETVTESIGIEHVIWHPNEMSRWDWDEEFGTSWISGYQSGVSPEQAIDATLGRGTCEVIGFDDGYDEGLDGEWFALAPATWFLSCDHEAHGRRPSYCPVCGRKVKEG